jgi:hypothetical protein
MNKDKLDAAIAEAERFLLKAKVARSGFTYREWQGGGGIWDYYMPDTAAAKRASMDLTKALADLRKPN